MKYMMYEVNFLARLGKLGREFWKISNIFP